MSIPRLFAAWRPAWLVALALVGVPLISKEDCYPARTTCSPRSRLQHSWRLTLALLPVLAIITMACGGGSQCTGGDSTPATRGTAYRVTAPLNCGSGAVVFFSGKWWKAQTAWSKAPSPPPVSGCGSKEIAGTMVLKGDQEAMFRTAHGELITFRPTTVGCA